MYKPSLIKTNARYRGPTESDKYINMIQEIIHDLRFLCYKIDSNENDPNNIGHREAIQGNVQLYTIGQADKAMINVPISAALNDNILEFQPINPIDQNNDSIKGRISKLDSEINFLLNNL